MKYALLILSFFLLATNDGKCQGWEWANGTRGCNNYGRFSSLDPYGNIYVTGETFTGMKFISDTIPSAPYTRVYLSKFDSSGNLLWAKANTGRNTTGRIGTLGLATDLFGNTYLLGCFDTVISFDANVLTNSYLGTYSGPANLTYMFLAKFDASGNNKWVKQIGNFPVPFWNIGNGIEVDCAGNIYLISNFLKNATIGTFSSLNNDTSGTTSDMLLAKLDSSGNPVWARFLGGNDNDYIVNVALTPTNDILVSGSFFQYQLVVGSDTLTDTSGLTGMATSFIAKFDNSGNPLWAKTNGDGTYAAFITDITTNANSEFFTSGYYSNDFTLDSYHLPYGAGSYGYLAKYDITGNLLWAKVMKGYYVFLEQVSLDGCGNAWVMGHFGTGIVTINDTIDGHIITPPIKNKEPIFVSGWSSSGSYINTTVLASGGRSSYRISMVTDRSNKIYVVGNNTLDTLKFISDTLYGTSSYTNMFLAKFDPNLECSPNHPLSCESLGQVDPNVGSLNVNIFPNPASSECTIQINDSYQDTKCTIWDITGRAIKTCQLRSTNTTISIAEIPAGVYTFRIEAKGLPAVNQKIVVFR